MCFWDERTLMISNRAASKFRCAYIQQQSLYRKTTRIHQTYFPPTNKGNGIRSLICTNKILKNMVLMPDIEPIWTNVWNIVISLHILERSHHKYKRLVRVLIDLFNANVPRPFSHSKIVAISIMHTRWYLNHPNIPFPSVSYIFLFT